MGTKKPSTGLNALSLLLAILLAVVFCHEDATSYRSECRNAVRSQSDDYDVVYACRWTIHPEKDTWWGDWSLGAHLNRLTSAQVQQLKAEVRGY